MAFFQWTDWLRSLRRPRVKTLRKKNPSYYRLRLEELETRLAPAIYTWTGAQAFLTGGVSNHWSNAGNWDSNGAPVVGAPVQLVFQSLNTQYFVANNDISGLVANQLTIASGSFTLTGTQELTLADPVSNTASIIVNSGAFGEVITMDMRFGTTVAGGASISVQAAASLTIGPQGTLPGAGKLRGNSITQLTKDGVGPLTLAGDNSGLQGPFTINNSTGNGSVIITNVNALGSPKTSAIQNLSINGAIPGLTLITLTYPDGVTNPSVNIGFLGNASDATSIQSELNSVFNGLGFIGNPVTVTRVASGFGSASFSIAFNGSMANMPVLKLTASATGIANAFTTILSAGGAPNITTVNPNTQLEVNVPNGAVVSNPITVSGAGIDNFAGAIQRTIAQTATLSGNILMNSDTTFGGVVNSTLNFTGTISDSATFDFTKEGRGTIFLNPLVEPSAATNFQGGNFYHGRTDVNNGLLITGHPFALGAGGGITALNTDANNSGDLAILYNGNFVSKTATLADFTQPAVGSSVTAPFATTAWMSVGQTVYIANGGYYSVASIGSINNATLTNLGSNGNATPGAIVETGAGAGTPTMPAQYVNIAQVQTITLTGAIAGTTRFTLDYNGVVTTPILYNGPGFGATAVALGIQSQLNAAGFGTIGGIGASVTVRQVGDTFNITFGGSLAGMQIPTFNATITTPFGTGSISVDTAAGTTPVGFRIPNEYLTIFDRTLSNLAGANTWEQPTAGTSANAMVLSNFAVFNVQLNTNLTINGRINGIAFTKVGSGRLILPNPNIFLLGPTIAQGALNVRDSAAMGGRNPTVQSGASLELQADGTPDTVGTAGRYNLYFPSSFSVTASGNGLNGEGAIYNMSGVNRIDGNVLLPGVA